MLDLPYRLSSLPHTSLRNVRRSIRVHPATCLVVCRKTSTRSNQLIRPNHAARPETSVLRSQLSVQAGVTCSYIAIRCNPPTKCTTSQSASKMQRQTRLPSAIRESCQERRPSLLRLIYWRTSIRLIRRRLQSKHGTSAPTEQANPLFQLWS